MRYEVTETKWSAIRSMLPNKARGVPRVDDRSVLNGILRGAGNLARHGVICRNVMAR